MTGWDDILGPVPAPVAAAAVEELPPEARGPRKKKRSLATFSGAATAPAQAIEDPRQVMIDAAMAMPMPVVVDRAPEQPMRGCRRYGNRWEAYIQTRDRAAGKVKWRRVGLYNTQQEAHEAYLAAGGSNFLGNNNQFVPRDEHRTIVRTLAIHGMPTEKICAHIINDLTGDPINQQTLLRHFGAEVAEGLRVGDAITMSAMHTQIIGRPAKFWTDPDGNYRLDATGKPIVLAAEVRPNVAATIFMSKVRPGIGLRDTTVIEHTRPVADDVYEKLKAIPREQLLEFRSALRRVAAQISEGEPEGGGPPSERE